MSKSLGGWIHSFAITETNIHKKGYTVYKITSIVFPRAVPEALTCITVWKRFREVKRLYRELLKRHKSLHIRGHMPEPKDPGYFKRFEPDVIQQRKDYILQLLDYTAQHPALYKSHPFLSFFENGHTPGVSPLHKSNIESICDSLDLPFESDISLIDPHKESESLNASFISDKDVLSGNDNSIENEQEQQSEEDNLSILTLNLTIPADNDYIYEAAYDFSRAVQAEVNQDYKEAFTKYNSGIEKLLGGSKDDTNDDRKCIAKAKVTKYMARAQEIYEKFLLYKNDDNEKILHLNIDIADSTKEVYLERPWNQLSKFKVMQIIDSVMQVQDVTDKCIYIMKTIQKPSSNSNPLSIFLPQNVPYMVNMLAFFQSDSALFLLLQHAKGGKLFDYVKTYTPTGHIASSLNEIFREFHDKNLEVMDSMEKTFVNTSSDHDSGFIDLLSEYKCGEGSSIKSPQQSVRSIELFDSPVSPIIENEEKYEYIPSFDTLSQDMDVNDLVSCSQKLLQAVSNTLEQYKELRLDDTPLVSKTAEIEIEQNDNKTDEDEENIVEAGILLNKSIGEGKKFEKEKNIRIILPEASVKQWAREMLIAIESLHLKDVTLGDLHPDNVLLGSKGELLLSYFYKSEGLQSNIDVKLDVTAVEGLYVAPERPLTNKSDWWSYGVILYELLTGYSFQSCHPGGLSSYYEIQYPEGEVSELAIDLLNGILQQNPNNRLDIDGIKEHGFFDGTCWDDVRTNSSQLTV